MNIKNLFGYNWYARRQILKSMKELPWNKLVESSGASFDCIRDIFIHSLQAEQFWIRRLTGGNTEEIFKTPFTKYADIKAIQKYADEVEAETNKYLKTLTDKELQTVFKFKGWDGKPKQHKTEDILMHVIEEEIHHRGELNCIYWQNDTNPPYTSYTAYIEQTRKK
jgi:uncharacterized damage-inducible protein DinB